MPYVYMNSVEYMEIQPELMQRGAEGRLGMAIMPVREVRASRVRWRQLDNYRGLQNMRGMDGLPVRIKKPGSNLFEYEPGVFGDFDIVEEKELTDRSLNLDVQTQPVDVADLVAESDEVLLGRELDRIESSIWALLTTGTISIYKPGENGPLLGWTYTYVIQSATAAILWSSTATATPIANLQAIQLLGQYAGRSVNFGSGAVAYMNSYTANLLLNNTNATDLGGRRQSGGGTYNTLNDVQQFLIGQNLPKMQVYDEGYIDLNGVYQKYIPNGKVVIIGQRPAGAKIGYYFKTINQNVPLSGRPGSYRYVIDHTRGPVPRTPPTLEIHRGHNGGPSMQYPSAVYVLTVA